ncbi:hypothetical protein ERO13_D13G103806v2 [Gossypium hirsutum]|uniref:Uncharacterized protein n=1 Tax=Gossypium darwinii TaxID=34276 RepID=A0A5D1ZXA2_GOSDA|nr:hypothetical protein ERO13_D13G103806v2 [Gossypium hirsutum]TYG37244.1 hypothetical protein ES288_D13G126100v1 [Gossypium darwinii]
MKTPLLFVILLPPGKLDSKRLALALKKVILYFFWHYVG